jgi:hypothetical protein
MNNHYQDRNIVILFNNFLYINLYIIIYIILYCMKELK